MDPAGCKHEKTKLVEINPYLTCHLCSGYLIDATTISECLHSFCRSCIIKFLQQNSYCPICEVIINKAKPNIKLDKTLQDIVYKLVPELFIREMTRRQQFYKNHPEMAAKVTPEERGVDTERTIFNPKDAISLSIEYIRDDSTPGAILIASPTETPINAKNIADNHSDNQMKRFLQCPGMCRIEVLKKFVRNKYNVDTNTFHIVILYKRVPLPNHYTLIDIAYIYSWKRNEPMKFFFRITDKNLATDGFDFIDDSPPPPEIFVRPTRTAKISGEKARSKGNAKKKVVVEKPAPKAPDVDVINTDKIKDEIKSKLQSDSNDKGPVYTNITLNRSNNVEIITKVQKVSNRNGQPIGLNIIKQTVKKARFAAEKPNVAVEKDESKPVVGKIILQRSESTPIIAEIKNEVIPTEAVDEEKSNFLKSIELTAKTEASSPIKKEPVKTPLKAAQKRKSSSPVRNDRVKKAKVEKGKNTKNLKNPDVRHMVKNVRNSATKLSKLVQKAPSNTNLQSLFDSCKINIPSSLSITLKESSEDDGDRLTATSMKPVQNYIEILKIPDQGEDKSKVADVENKPAPKPALKDNVVKLNPRSAQTFQKMFEEAIKKPEVNDKDDDKKGETESSTRRNILEIASRLYKKTKLDLEREEGAKAPAGKIAIPRLNTQKCLKPQKLDAKIANFRFEQTFANMHSPSLGMNYTVSVENERKKPNGLTIETKPADGPSTAKTVKNTKLQNVPTTPAKNLLTLQTLRGNPTQNLPVSLQNALKYSMEFKQTPANGKTAVSSPLTSPRNWARNSSQSSPRPSSSPKPSSPSNVSPRPYISPRAATTPNVSPRSNASPKPNVSPRPNMSPIPNVPSPRLKPLNVPNVKDKIPNRSAPQPAHLSSTPMSPNQILEKYNIQNLAQLTASFNFNQSAFGLPHSPHLAALQQAVILKQFEMQNRQSWLNMNQNSLVQYEKYLQSLGHGGLVTKEN